MKGDFDKASKRDAILSLGFFCMRDKTKVICRT